MLKKIILLIVAVITGGFLISHFLKDDQAGDKTDSQGITALVADKTYVCPMHPHIVSHKEDTCPICGMDLVLKKSDSKVAESSGSKDNTATPDYPEVKISPTVTNNLGIRTSLVKRGNLTHDIETIGKITRVDPMARSRVTSPINGTIQKIVDKYPGDRVKQDEFLFSVESEELFNMEQSFQKEFLEGNKNKASMLINKLVAMGLDTEQIAKLQNGEEPNLPVKKYAKEQGYIFARRGKEGDPVTSAFTVFNLGGDYQVIEVTVEIFERQWDVVKEGQTATMELRNLPGKIFHGVIERVDEPVGYTTRALETRIKFKTDYKGLTQSTFARVMIKGKSKQDVILVPRDAVIRTARGNRIVKINKDGNFQPVVVNIGEESNGKIEIISGVKPGDKVIVSGQFLIDSESNLLADLQRMSTMSTMSPMSKTDKSSDDASHINSEHIHTEHKHSKHNHSGHNRSKHGPDPEENHSSPGQTKNKQTLHMHSSVMENRSN